MTDPVSLTFGIAGVVGSVIQGYNAVMSAYNLYLEVKDVPSEYEDLRMGLLLEHQRLELWGSHVRIFEVHCPYFGPHLES